MSIIRAGIVGSDNDEDVLELGPQVGDERLGARFLEWKTKFNTLSNQGGSPCIKPGRISLYPTREDLLVSNQGGSPCIQHIKTHSSNDQHYPMMFEMVLNTLVSSYRNTYIYLASGFWNTKWQLTHVCCDIVNIAFQFLWIK